MSYFAPAAGEAQSFSYPPRLKAAPAATPAPTEVLKNSLLLIWYPVFYYKALVEKSRKIRIFFYYSALNVNCILATDLCQAELSAINSDINHFSLLYQINMINL
jgi:hypothetical protein